jgi:hypothetical protein
LRHGNISAEQLASMPLGDHFGEARALFHPPAVRDVGVFHVRTRCQLLVVDADENGSASVTGCAAGEEPGTAAAEAEFLNQLSD